MYFGLFLLGTAKSNYSPRKWKRADMLCFQKDSKSMFSVSLVEADLPTVISYMQRNLGDIESYVFVKID